MHSIDHKLVIGLHRTVSALDARTARLVASSGLSLPQFSALEALFSKGPMSVGVLRDTILSSVGTIGVIVKNLEQQGLVTRSAAPDDKRICILSITQQGIALMQDIMPKNDAIIHEFFSGSTAAEKEQLLKVLKRLTGRLV